MRIDEEFVVEVAMPPSTSVGAHSLQVTLMPTEGDPDVGIFYSTGTLKATVARSDSFAGHDVATVRSNNVAPGAALTVEILPKTEFAEFNLIIEVVPDSRKISARDSDALAAISQACCSHGLCTPNFAKYPEDRTSMDPCRMPASHCNNDGGLTHLLIADWGLKCKAADLAPLADMLNLHSFTIAKEDDLTGDINTFLGHFQGTHQLRFITIDSTGLTGELPETCPSGGIYDKLVSLELKRSNVGGSIPDCFMGLEQLSIVTTAISGPMPTPPDNSPMRIFVFIQEADGSPRLSGDAAAFGALPNLQQLILTHTGHVGQLRVGTATQVVDLRGVPVEDFFAPDTADELRRVIIVYGKLAGPVPLALLNLPKNQELYLHHNSLTSFPDDWSAPELFVLHLEQNELVGPVPAALASQPELRLVDVSHNLLSGPLSLFEAALSNSNVLYYVDFSSNSLSGSLGGLDELNVFAPHRPGDLALTYGGIPVPKLLNVSNNNFDGSVPPRYYAKPSAGGPDNLPLSMIDMRSNPFIQCPAQADVSPSVTVECDNSPSSARESPRAVGESRSQGLADGAIAGIVLSVLALAAVIGGCGYMWIKKHKQKKAEAWTAEGPFVPFPNGRKMPPVVVDVTALDATGQETVPIEAAET